MSRFGGFEDQPMVAELYDSIYGDIIERGDVDFYLEFSRSACGAVLELGCGTGRILLPTAVAGCQVVGLDLSPYMLAKCREKLDRQPRDVRKRVRLVQENMTTFDLKESFSLVTTPFRSFQHLLSVGEQLACLLSINRHLKMGGNLILDLFQVDPRVLCNTALTKESEDISEAVLPDGRRFKRCHRIVAQHRAEQYADIELIFYVTDPNGKTERVVQAFPLRHFYRYEVEHLLARCGFATVAIFGNFDQSPLTDDSPEMIVLAEKTEEFPAISHSHEGQAMTGVITT